MNKTTLTTVMTLALALMLGSIGFAQTTFTVSATIPAATGISITPSQVDSQTNQFSAVSGTNLSFDPMSLDTQNGIYLPDHFFALDIGATGGAGSPTVTVTYTEGANPNSPGNGLGTKATATFVKVEGTGSSEVQTGLTNHGPKKMLKNLSGEQVDGSEIAGGFLRIYLGIVTGDPNATFPDPTGSEVFTNADAPGTYDGTLVISGTVS
ncbi:MAG: hypothetical protein H6755_06220 [Candidatus Omnitrophica bacterium]|nr:hypothetical protein [Candidatus Omnitrophota bacterium]MCB9747986.1 hypothetical protein [Candidatus Omnitrophota bacterium]